MNIIHLICSQDIHNRQEINLLISRIMYVLLGNIFSPSGKKDFFILNRCFHLPLKMAVIPPSASSLVKTHQELLEDKKIARCLLCPRE